MFVQSVLGEEQPALFKRYFLCHSSNRYKKNDNWEKPLHRFRNTYRTGHTFGSRWWHFFAKLRKRRQQHTLRQHNSIWNERFVDVSTLSKLCRFKSFLLVVLPAELLRHVGSSCEGWCHSHSWSSPPDVSGNDWQDASWFSRHDNVDRA